MWGGRNWGVCSGSCWIAKTFCSRPCKGDREQVSVWGTQKLILVYWVLGPRPWSHYWRHSDGEGPRSKHFGKLGRVKDRTKSSQSSCSALGLQEGMDTGNKMRQTELILLTAFWKHSSPAFSRPNLSSGRLQITSVASWKPWAANERKEEGQTSTAGLEAIITQPQELTTALGTVGQTG